jgi:hypothetical protein
VQEDAKVLSFDEEIVEEYPDTLREVIIFALVLCPDETSHLLDFLLQILKFENYEIHQKVVLLFYEGLVDFHRQELQLLQVQLAHLQLVTLHSHRADASGLAQDLLALVDHPPPSAISLPFGLLVGVAAHKGLVLGLEFALEFLKLLDVALDDSLFVDRDDPAFSVDEAAAFSDANGLEEGC